MTTLTAVATPDPEAPAMECSRFTLEEVWEFEALLEDFLECLIDWSRPSEYLTRAWKLGLLRYWEARELYLISIGRMLVKAFSEKEA